MKTVSSLCAVWQEHVKEFFSGLHGHQSKALAFFVLGAIKAQSIVGQRLVEALLSETEVSVTSIERRYARFLSNPRFDTQQTWDGFLGEIMPYFRQQPMHLVIDLTAYEEHAQVIYLGLLQQSRVLPLVWKVMPGQTKWDQGLWDCIDALFGQLAPHLGTADCTIIGDSAFGCFPMVALCQKYGWHYLFRMSAQHTCQRFSSAGRLLPSQRVAELVNRPGKRFYGRVRLWQEQSVETNVSAYWDPAHEEALLVMSDQPACRRRLSEYRWRMRVEATFQDLKSRGWDWEDSHVRDLERIERMLLLLFLAVWWLAHLAASCIHNGRRWRYDRADRRDKSLLRIGRLYLFDLEQRATCRGDLIKCLPFRRTPTGWHFALRF